MMRALVALTLLLVNEARASSCIAGLHSTKILTSAHAVLPADGAVLVAVEGEHLPPEFGDGDDQNGLDADWRFRDGTKEHAPTMVPLAPGLFAYHPPAGANGSWALVDGKVTKANVDITKDKEALLGAPAVQRVVYSKKNGIRLDATFKAAPEGAVAIVVYVVREYENAPRSWVAIKPGAKKALVGVGGRCVSTPPGTIVSEPDETVVLAWVDKHGRLSAFSKPITVKGS